MNPSRPLRRLRAQRLEGRFTRLCLILLLLAGPALNLIRAAEPDPRMIPPLDAVRGKLPSLSPTPAIDAWKTFRVLDGFRRTLPPCFRQKMPF